jgi:hypothetical protein
MKKNIIIILFILMSLIVYQTYFSNTDKKDINNIIEQLHQSLEYKGVLAPLAVVSRLKTIKSHLAPEFTAKSITEDKERTLGDVKRIKDSALVASRYFSNIDITKMPFLIDVNGAKASATFSTIITGQDKQGGMFKELFDLKMAFIKRGGKWYCSSLSAERLTPDN